MPTPADRPALKMLGEPHRLAMGAAVFNGQTTATIDLPEGLADAHGARTITAAVRLRAGENGRIRLRLAKTTPPGIYRAEVRTGDSATPIDIEVLPTRRLKVSPPGLRFSGAVGDDCRAAFILVNAGNAPFEVPERAHFGIYDNEGVETAFATAYRENDEPMELIKTFVRKLRDGHGGLLKLRIEGAGPVEPGGERMVVATARIHDRLKPGHAYHGVWKLQDLNYAVSVDVAGLAGEPK